jgi:hypothetical protein
MSDTRARSFTWSHIGVVIIGILLIVAPLVIQLPSRGAAGQNLLNAFEPIMAPANVTQAADYYNNDFVPLGSVATGGVAAASEIPTLISTLATQFHQTPAQVEAFLGKDFPAFAQLLSAFPQLVPVFQKIPAGLTAYKPLIDTMQAQEGNYAAVNALPNFNLFTWFFIIPGILLILLGGFPLLLGRKKS